MTPLDFAHETYVHWFGESFDLEALDIVLAVSAGLQLSGDLAWLLLVAGPATGKTETIQSLAAAGAVMASSISSEGALLSATSKREQTDSATGGLLRTIGDKGILVLKDFTTILSMSNDSRNQVLAALREIYDGRWTRNVGPDGGQTLEWSGRIVLVGAVTTAWDSAHSVVSEMGDRFLLVRLDSTKGRIAASRQAISNVGSEIAMRKQLASSVKAALEVNPSADLTLTEHEELILIRAADLVTRARTAVLRDYQGNVIGAHAPESPTRFVKQLAQVMRGALALDMSHERALRLALRAAKDSLPPMRLACLVDIQKHPHSLVSEVRKRLDKPRSSVDRELQALHQLGLFRLEEIAIGLRAEWRYSMPDEEYQLAVKMLTGTTKILEPVLEYYPSTPKVQGTDCAVCGTSLHASLIEAGLTIHPTCDNEAA